MKTIEITDYRSKHNVLTAPLTIEELKEAANKFGYISSKLTIELESLIDGDLERLNDEVSERITTSVCGLMDISYDVAGRIASSGEIILKVTAQVNFEDLEE
jgi:hypothetical protein